LGFFSSRKGSDPQAPADIFLLNWRELKKPKSFARNRI
jgi:hypothetical protein